MTKLDKYDDSAAEIRAVGLRADAYARLRIDGAAVLRLPQITPELRSIAKVIRRDAPYGAGSDLARSWPLYLQSSESPHAYKLTEAYLDAVDAIGKRAADAMPIEAYCLTADVPTMTILEILVGVVVRQGAQASTIIAAVNHPRVVQKTVEMALTDDGIEDRNTLHKAVGFLPTPKGAQTTIQVTQNANAAATAQAASLAPPPEATIRKLADRFNADRAIPISEPAAIAEHATAGGTPLPDFAPTDDREFVPIDINDADDEDEV